MPEVDFERFVRPVAFEFNTADGSTIASRCARLFAPCDGLTLRRRRSHAATVRFVAKSKCLAVEKLERDAKLVARSLREMTAHLNAAIKIDLQNRAATAFDDRRARQVMICYDLGGKAGTAQSTAMLAVKTDARANANRCDCCCFTAEDCPVASLLEVSRIRFTSR